MAIKDLITNAAPARPQNEVEAVKQILNESIEDIKKDASITNYDKGLLETVLNNTLNYYTLLESSTIGAGAMQNIILFTLPVVRKLMPGLISRNLIPTYPIDAAEAKIRFLRYYRGDGKEPFKNTSVVLPEHYNAYSDMDAYGYNQTYASSDLIDYINFTNTGATYGAGTNVGTYFTDFHVTYPTLDLLSVHPETGKYAKLYKFTVTDPDGGVNVFTADDFNDPTVAAGVITWTIPACSFDVQDTAGGTGPETITSITVTLDADATSATFGDITVTLTGNATVQNIVVAAYVKVFFDQEEQPGQSVNLKMEYYDVKTETRKLSTHISTEAFMLASKQHGLDIDSEMVETTSMLLAFELDRWIISEIYNAAITESTVTARTFDAALPPTWVTGPQFYYMFLIDQINKQSAEIYRRSLRGQAKWIVTSPEVYAVLALTGMVSGINEYEKDSAGQIEMGGKVAHKYDVYVDPYFGNRMLLGYNAPDGSLNTGGVFVPFIPLALLPPDYRSKNSTFNYGAYTRSAVTIFDANCYGVIDVTGI